MVTDFEGTEQAAAISRDGRMVAFTSDRDGTIDVWIGQVGTGEFHNLTRGAVQQLVNPSVRTLGFSPDGSSVTLWARGVAGAKGNDIGIWSIPVLGGEPRPYLEGVAEFDWSRDGSRLVFHTPGPGDPTFVVESHQQGPRRKIFEAAAGLHAHFPTWSPAGDYVYFVQGSVPDAMDLWRMKPGGDAVERLTQHNAMVSHPVWLDDTTLLYLASGADGAAQRLYSLNVRDGVSQVLGTGLDRYTSLSASADGRRIVATRSNPKASLWRLPIGDAAAAPAEMKIVSMPTGRGFAPRLGAGLLLYVSQKGTGDAIWKVTDAGAAELWSASDARVFGGPELSSDGSRVAFSVEQRGGTLLYAMNSDGTDVRVVNDSLQLHGSPAWAPDGRSIVSGASVNGNRQLLRIPLEGPPVTVLPEFAVDPVWSPAGGFIVYSAADVGTQFPLKAVAPDGEPYRVPSITLTRGARRLRFSQGGRALLMMRGDIRHKDVWIVDLETGEDRQVTQLPPDFNIRDFDMSPDGKEITVERVQDHSDIVLIERPPRDR
jgi:Tol biopolymer transport system component